MALYVLAKEKETICQLFSDPITYKQNSVLGESYVAHTHLAIHSVWQHITQATCKTTTDRY